MRAEGGSNERRIMKIVLGILLCFPFVLWCIIRIIMDVTFDTGCGGYLAQAAAASSIETAKEPLATALGYLESHGMTHGNTGVVFHYPQNDVGFFYKNLKAAQAELESMGNDSPPLAQSNVLMKLHEAIKAHAPQGISGSPYNVILCVLAWITGVFGAVGLLLAGSKMLEH